MNHYLDILFYNESIKVFILSMLPIAELRLSIPYGIFSTNLSIYEVVLLSISGNILIGLLIIYMIGPMMDLLQSNKFLKTIIFYIFNRTRKRGKIIYRLKFIGLILFVGVPLPLTGVWTGSLAAFLFGLSKKHSLLAISFGVFISSTIVTTLSLITKYSF
tara:strand:- start:193 stop:672 length:480 start_codon:yes stop_codon:yes gene_type:complete